MEWELFGLVSAVVCAILFFVMYTLGSRGQSYEEAVAANRRLVAQRGLLDDPAKQKRIQQQQTKKNKKAGKKVKEKQAKERAAATTSNSEIESEVPVESGVEDDGNAQKVHVEFAAPAIVVTPEEIKPPKSKKKSKDTKVKSILINKDDPSCVSDVSAPPSPTDTEPANHFELIHPKDEFELLHDKEKVAEVPPKKEKEPKKPKSDKNIKSVTKQEKEKPVEVPVVTEPPKEQRKNKNKPSSQPPTEETNQPSIAISHPTDLTTDKILKQTYSLESSSNSSVTDGVPAVKPSTSAVPQNTKVKKKKNELAQYQQLLTCPEGVNVNLLVQLLGEASLSRSEIQILTDCLLNKQNGPLPEHSEWSEGPKDPLQKLKKQLAEKEKALQDEQEATQAVQAKLKELRATLNAERSRCTQISASAEEVASVLRNENASLLVRIQRGIDENNALRQQVHQLQAKVAADAELSAQQMEKLMQSLTEKNMGLTSTLTSLQTENDGLRKSNVVISAELENALIRVRGLEEYRQQAEKQKDSMTQKEQRLLHDLRLAEGNDKALSEAKSEIHKLSTSSKQLQQEMLRHEQQKEDFDKQTQQLNTEIHKLKSEKEELNKSLSELKEKLAAQPTSNGTTSPDQSATLSVEKAVAAACRELEERHSQQMASLQSQLDQYRDKNNDLRTKNWKVMEAYQAAEKKLQQNGAQKSPDEISVREAVTKACLEEQNRNKELLQRLFPQISVTYTDYQDWTKEFVNVATNILSTQNSNLSTLQETSKGVKDIEAHNEKLQLMVDNYVKIFKDMDETLSKLQADAIDVDNQWKKKLAEKEKELDDLKIELENVAHCDTVRDTESFQKNLDNKSQKQDIEIHEITSLASKLKTEYGGGMADIERLLEENSRLRETVERLQSSSQSLNGPSQFLPITAFERKTEKKRRSLSGWLRRKITFRRKKSKDIRNVDRKKDHDVAEETQKITSIENNGNGIDVILENVDRTEEKCSVSN